MPNHMKFCGCKWCRAGRSTAWSKRAVRAIVRKMRHNARRALKRGDDDVDTTESVPYTD
jgi:hypothetical protein